MISQALKDIAAERERQASDEGWTPEHDDSHTDGSLAQAAAAYTLVSIADPRIREHARLGQLMQTPYASIWPHAWSRRWFKPTDPRRDLVKAAALIVAEIERLDRKQK